MKPGWKTTEFWAALATNSAIFITSEEGQLTPHNASYAAAIVTGLYMLSRGLTKGGTSV